MRQLITKITQRTLSIFALLGHFGFSASMGNVALKISRYGGVALVFSCLRSLQKLTPSRHVFVSRSLPISAFLNDLDDRNSQFFTAPPSLEGVTITTFFICMSDVEQGPYMI